MALAKVGAATSTVCSVIASGGGSGLEDGRLGAATTDPCPKSLSSILNYNNRLVRASDEKELEGCSTFVPINGGGLTGLNQATTVASEHRDTNAAPAVQAWDLERRGITEKAAGGCAGEIAAAAAGRSSSISFPSNNRDESSRVAAAAAGRSFSVSLPSSSRGSFRAPLPNDLFPEGVTSSVPPSTMKNISPIGGQRSTEPAALSSNSIISKAYEPELEGSQTWTCLVPTTALIRNGQAGKSGREAKFPPKQPAGSAPVAAVAAALPKKVQQREVLPLPAAGTMSPLIIAQSSSSVRKTLSDIMSAATTAESALHQDSSTALTSVDGLTRPFTVPTAPTVAGGNSVISHVASTAAVAAAVAAADHNNHTVREERVKTKEGTTGPIPVSRVVAREGEEELRRALDRLMPRLRDRDERVNYLESRLQEAMRGESGRNALIKQVAKLEGEVKHLRERLDMRQAEALKWRDQRQALEAETERLNAELHRALDRCSRAESEGRRKDTLLTEARVSKDNLVEAKASFEVELRHKEQLLRDAETDRKRAWQTTNASAEAAAVAARKAAQMEREAERLRREVWLNNNNGGSEQSNDRRHSTAPSVGLRSISESDPASTSRRLSVGDTPRMGGRVNGGIMERDRNRGVSFSPDQSDREIAHDQSDILGRRMLHQDHDPHLVDRTVRPPEPPSPPPLPAPTQRPPLVEGVSPLRDAPVNTLVGTDARQTGRRSSADSNGVRSALTAQSPECEDFSPTPQRDEAPVTPMTRRTPGGREQCESGDRERHDSNGVRGALTAAIPEWAGTASEDRYRQEGRSPANRRRRRRSDGDGYRSDSFRYRGGIDYEWGDDRGASGGGAKQEVELASADGRPQSGIGWNTDRNSTRNGCDTTEEGEYRLNHQLHRSPAAGQRRGRDEMSSRRSSLSGAGVGVQGQMTYGEDPRTSESARSREQRVPNSNDDDPPWGARNRATTNESDGMKQDAGISMSSPPTARSLADVIEGREPVVVAAPCSDREEHRWRKRASVPFATDEVDEALQPQRELERKLMLLQMEMSQLQAEQTRLLPKATKTIQGRGRMRDIEGRLEWLAKEASSVRTAIRRHSRQS